MPQTTGVIGRVMQVKIPWKWIGPALGAVIVVISAITLVRLLGDVAFDRVLLAIKEKDLTEVAIACIFVAIGYVTLTFYDFFALRTIGRDAVPYRVAALASFTSYTIGHNVGATVFSGGLIRYRIYSGWGLTILDVAKIAFVTGLTFWLGNAFVLGVSLVYAPEAVSAVDQLPPWINRTIGLMGLAVIGGYLLWLIPRRRVIGRDTWQIALPSSRLTLVQIGIGVLDLGAGAIGMYFLLPSDAEVGFVTVLVVFVAAMLLGFLSHAPGSLGVIEAAMLVGLPQLPKEELLASLLIFRVLYFVLPLCIAAALLALREFWLMARPEAPSG
jgi:uncharacterized membrane protein YbhN (UPF0104 family)